MATENSAQKNGRKITFVMGSLTAGGAEKVASFLMMNFHRNGHQVSLITRHNSEIDFFTIPDSIRRIVLGGEGESANKWIGLLKNVAYVMRLRKALKTTQPDVVISFLTRPNIYTIIATRFMNCRMIISERSDTTRQKHGWPWNTLRKIVYKFADVVTANSQTAIEGMKPYVQTEKLVMVPNPVEIPNEVADTANSKVILNVGRLEKVKNQKFIMNAFAKSGLAEEGWKLEFAGDGSEAEHLMRYKNTLDCHSDIHFAGLVKNMDECYRKASLFILASDFEGTPNALLEAMSYGLPSIVSDSLPGAVELIGKDCGVVFQHASLEDLVNKITHVSNLPVLRKIMGEKARKKIEIYSPDRVFLIWERILTD